MSIIRKRCPTVPKTFSVIQHVVADGATYDGGGRGGRGRGGEVKDASESNKLCCPYDSMRLFTETHPFAAPLPVP